MATWTVDQHACGPFPTGHSIEDHLDAERKALTTEWQSAQRAGRNDRWMMIRAAGLGLALAGTIALGWRQTHPTGNDGPACPAATADAAGAPSAGDC